MSVPEIEHKNTHYDGACNVMLHSVHLCVVCFSVEHTQGQTNTVVIVMHYDVFSFHFFLQLKVKTIFLMDATRCTFMVQMVQFVLK